MKKKYLLIFVCIGLLTVFNACQNGTAYKALIVTGQNNHLWKSSFPILEQLLEQTGLFTVDIAKSPDKGGDMSIFTPDFSKYNVSLSTTTAIRGLRKPRFLLSIMSTMAVVL